MSKRKFQVYLERDNIHISLPINLCISDKYCKEDYPDTEFIGTVEANGYEDAIKKIKEKLSVVLSND